MESQRFGGMMMNVRQLIRLFSLAVCVLVPLETTAREPDVKQYAERSAKERSERLKALHRELAIYRGKKRRDLAVEYNSTRWEFPEKRPKVSQYIAEQMTQRNERIKQFETEIADLENPLKPYFCMRRPMHVGEIGMLKNDIKVFQVLDDSCALLEFLSYDSGDRLTPTRLYDSSGESRVQHVMTGGPPRESSQMFWLSGVSTGTFQDGRHIEIEGFFVITGNRTYETVGGSRTVLVVEPFDITPYEEMFSRRGERRIWTSNDGQHTTEAIFIRSEQGRVTLMNLEGKTTKVRLSELSDDDRKYVRERIEATDEGGAR